MGSRPAPTQPTPRVPLQVGWFLDEILVECPKCGGCAIIRKILRKAGRSGLTCVGCGYSPESLPEYDRRYRRDEVEGLDPFYGLPLWLRASARRGMVWAYNWRHFEDLEFFLTSDWKMDRHRLPGTTVRRTYRTRLPKWMQETKSRDDLLRALRGIRRRRFR